MGLFEEKPAAQTPVTHPALEALTHADVNRMTPLDALHLVAQLKAMVTPSK
jgi:hypothetical protein